MGRKRNHKYSVGITIALAAVLLVAGVWHFVELSRASTESVTVSAIVLGCGDGLISVGEDCDGSNMNGHTCQTEGFLSGSISCQPNCTLQTGACSMNPPTSGGGGGSNVSFATTEIFKGTAYPGSTVTVLKDGQFAGNTVADAVGEFLIRLNNLTNSTYTFGFFATDILSNSSALTTLTLEANGGTVTTEGIFLSPTIEPARSAIEPGSNLTIFGYSAPRASVTVTIRSPGGSVIFLRSVPTDTDGKYSLDVITNGFQTKGEYTVTAVASLNGEVSTQSRPMIFTVGPSLPAAYMKGDYNEDRRVNLVDFSIALYWYKQPLTDAFKILEKRHGNGDGVLDLIDISILAYWWTG